MGVSPAGDESLLNIAAPIAIQRQMMDCVIHNGELSALETSSTTVAFLQHNVRSLEAGKSILEQEGNSISRSRTWDPVKPGSHQRRNLRKASPDWLSEKRRYSLQLPSFKTLGISSGTHTPLAPEILPENTMPQVCVVPSAVVGATLCGVLPPLPPLTPPPEVTQVSKPNQAVGTKHSGSTIYSVSQVEQSSHITSTSDPASGETVHPMALPGPSNPTGASEPQRSPWVAKASHKMVAALDSTTTRKSVLMVSQTLPSQAKDSRVRPTFEEILETFQTALGASPFITITHAVPPARVMDELPKTPPSTPYARHDTSDYFTNDQTIFTHAAVVPIYHTHDRAENSLLGKQHISAPCSVHATILERYIPPTMPEEVDDFFSVSSRSYLADRLSELSDENGSLLLVYPTAAGGRTFARRYISPIIDPYLRQFIMLNGLTSSAAALMGKMSAVDYMVDFEEMQHRITNLCQTLTKRQANRGPKSQFTLEYADTANVTLDRSTWMNWYLEQESSRLRQNLVEYHQAGGRMPAAEGNREITIGMLVRDLIDGIQKSKEPAGDAEIEVGVFIVTRSML